MLQVYLFGKKGVAIFSFTCDNVPEPDGGERDECVVEAVEIIPVVLDSRQDPGWEEHEDGNPGDQVDHHVQHQPRQLAQVAPHLAPLLRELRELEGESKNKFFFTRLKKRMMIKTNI